MRPNKKSFTWQTASTFAVCCFLGGVAVSLGVHEHRVGDAVEEARAQARLLDEERAKLEETLAKAREVSEVSEALSDEELVAAAATELSQAANDAANAAANHKIEVSATAVVPPSYLDPEGAATELHGPYATSPTITLDPSAVLGATAAEDEDAVEESAAEEAETEASEQPSASPTPEATESADATDGDSGTTADDDTDTTVLADGSLTAEDEAEALAEIVQETEVAQVLRGEVDDLETVTATVARLEAAASQLDVATRRIEGTTAVLEAATAEAALEKANLSLDERIEAIKATASSTKDMIEAVDGNVADEQTIADAKAARKALVAYRETDVDREDAEALEAVKVEIEEATAAVAEAEEALYASHQKWVKQENARRESVNEERLAQYKRDVAAAYEAMTADYRYATQLRASGWSGAPSGVTYSNGGIPSSQLCELSFASGHMLQCDAADALEAADDDYYAQTGSHLDVSSSYRSYSAQVATKASKGYLAATPGTSNHGWGMAADFGSASATWMRQNGEDYGWVHPLWARSGGSKPESWHLEFVAPGVSANLPEEPNMLAKVKSSLTS
ncbi:M15 family metallopeptidase [Demequina mangrovi]|uniref:D-alanyl-D-alanine carboxypeptidase n=1 Tax=Demequina mangrovi TaxID=1043493 RepID=A0A1H6TTU8_9MICO|nr:M15 family metallopeptidase [Demequina mangrovi]SEI83498.1 D-alanyl-D-alanine carboxypeptidase [Demequina mangrovi]